MTIDPIATLHVLAQIAITLVGFTAIAITFRERSDGSWTREKDVYLDSIITPPLFAIFLCFLPQLIALAYIETNLAWRIANGIAAILRLISIVRFLLIARGTNLRPSQYLTLTTGVLIVLAGFLAAANILIWQELIYVLGVVQPIAVGLNNFVLMLRRPQGTDANDSLEDNPRPTEESEET